MRILRVAMIGVVLATACSVRVSGGQMFPQTPASKQGQQQMPGMPGRPGLGTNPADPDPMDPHRADSSKREVAEQLTGRSGWWRTRINCWSLATDLKAQVDKSTKDTLSVDVIKKAEEIEKLAHSVKERMKG